jgi:CysZ protein
MMTSQAPPGPPAALVLSPAAPLERPTFGAGLRAVFGGYRYLFKTPDIWPLALVPTVVALVLASVLGTIAVRGAPALVAALVDKPTGGVWSVLYVVLQVLAAVVALALALALSFSLGKPLSGPALERILRRVEGDLGAPTWPAPTLLQDIGRSLQSTLIAAAFTLPILAVLALVSFFFPPASVVTFPIQLAVTAIAGAWDFCDYPLSIRGVPVAQRIDFVRRNFGAVMGFGFGLALLSFLPCTLLIVVPAGVIGAAQLTVSLERWEAAKLPR